jgi:hypothetical protein
VAHKNISFYRHTFHNFTRRDTSVFPDSVSHIAFIWRSCANLSFATAYYHYCVVQPHAWTYVWGIRSKGAPGPFSLLPFRLQCLQLRERVDHGRRMVDSTKLGKDG